MVKFLTLYKIIKNEDATGRMCHFQIDPLKNFRFMRYMVCDRQVTLLIGASTRPFQGTQTESHRDGLKMRQSRLQRLIPNLNISKIIENIEEELKLMM